MTTKIPSIPDPRNIDGALRALKEIIEIREGLRGEKNRANERPDKFVSVRDLESLVLNNRAIIKALAITLNLVDMDGSNFLALEWGEDDVDNRSLSLKVNGGNRTLDLAGSLAVESASVVDQDLTQDAGPTFADLTLSSPVNIYDLSHDGFADFSADEHFVQTDITHVSDALPGGLLTVTEETGVIGSIPDNSGNWDAAYGWGDHDLAGYVTGTPWTLEGYITDISGFTTDSLSEGDINKYFPGFTSLSDDYGFTDNSSAWNAAYGWGDHDGLYEPGLGNPASNGYVLSSTTLGVRSWVEMTGGAGHDEVTLDANAGTILSLSTQVLGLDTQTANLIFAGPSSGAAAVPAFRSLDAADIPDLSATYLTDITGESFADLSDVPAHPALANKILETTEAGYAWIDTPTGGEAEEEEGVDATWNPSDKHSNIALSNEYRTATATGANAWKSVRGVPKKTSGKYYFEVLINAINGSRYTMVGVGTADATLSNYTGYDAYGWSYYGNAGKKAHNSSITDYGNSFTANDIIGVAVDLDAGKIWFSKNGTWQAGGDPAAGTDEAFSGLSGAIFPMLSPYAANDSDTLRSSAETCSYSPPSGFSYWRNTELGEFSDVGAFVRARFMMHPTAYKIYAFPALYMVKNKVAAWYSLLTTDAISSPAANTWYYLYLDYSEIISSIDITASEMYWSTTGPTHMAADMGWYSGDDRCIFAVRTNSTPTGILEFHHDGGDKVTYGDGIADRVGADVDTTWTDVTLTIPGFCYRATCLFYAANTGVQVADMYGLMYWQTNGQSGTKGHFAGISYIPPTAWTIQRNMNTIDVYTDSSRRIEVKYNISDTNLAGVDTEGWFFPGGM